MPLKPSSAKSKGRRLQQQLVAAILARFDGLEADDVRSNPMGCNGEDVLLSPRAREAVPWSFECKNSEGMAPVFAAYRQSEANARGFPPAVVVKKNFEAEPLCVVSLSDFLSLAEKAGRARAGADQGPAAAPAPALDMAERAEMAKRLRSVADQLDARTTEAGPSSQARLCSSDGQDEV